MKSIIKYIALGLIILLLISGVAAFFQLPFSSKNEISLSGLSQSINEGKVKEITVKGDKLEVTMTDDTKQTSKKEVGVPITETLVNLNVDRAKLAKVNITVSQESGLVFFLLNSLPFILPFLIILVLFWLMFRSAQHGAMQAFSFGKSKARLANTNGEGKKVFFKDVAGLKEVKEEIQEVVEFLKDPKKFHKVGAKIPRGILLVGPPGTGKTMLAKAVANEAGVPFFYVSGSDFVELFVGVGANRVRDMFETAKKHSPSVVFIDELDAIGRHRGAGLGGGHDEREQTLNQILVEMDGFGTDDRIIVLSSTNRPDILDPALLRPGRFDRKIALDMPSINDRTEVLKIHSTDKPLADDVNLKVVAERTPGFSGADLANLMNEAAILAARKNQDKIHQLDIFQAIEKVLLGPERKSHILSKKEKEIAAYHEAGHALVAVSLPHTDPVHKVSIVSRGRAGGFTLKVPSEDRHLKSKSEFESELAVLLGGFSAEKIVFNDLTTGASNDLKVASTLARKMVSEYGMSDKIGPISLGEKEELVFLGKDFGTEKNYSEQTAILIDQEMKKLITKGLLLAKKILNEKVNLLHKIAKTLIEKETLEQKEFYSLLKA